MNEEQSAAAELGPGLTLLARAARRQASRLQDARPKMASPLGIATASDGKKAATVTAYE